MLTHLQIRDFAIVESVELELRAGLTVLTGETGAGKSILVDALQLLVGGRAGAEVVRHGAERAEVSGTFEIARAPPQLRRWLEEQSIAAQDELLMRRVVAADGRSRGYLNGQTVPIQSLREAGDILIDIHGQHEFQSLTRAPAQRELLDGYGKLETLTGQVGIAYRVWLELLNRTLELESRARDRDGRLALLKHQVLELDALRLQEGELLKLDAERERLANGGRLAEAADVALRQLYENDEGSAHASVSRALTALRAVKSADPKLAAVVPLVEEASVQIREAARELSQYREGMDLDAGRQDEIERRLAAIEDLARKHRVSPAQLPGRVTELTQELEALERSELDLAALRRDLGAALVSYQEQAAQLSARRRTSAQALAKDITRRMQTLGMSGGRFEIDVSQEGKTEPTVHGIDAVEFRVSANPGQPPRALAKVASGGELARLSLAVQVACTAQEARCMVFDEVDAGIGGAVAEIVGRELRSLGERVQVLCVTHLPQVASQSHQHLRVSKAIEGRTTRTAVAQLNEAERIEELARMLGGVEVSVKAREHAREMLSGTLGVRSPESTPPEEVAAPAAARKRSAAAKRQP